MEKSRKTIGGKGVVRYYPTHANCGSREEAEAVVEQFFPRLEAAAKEGRLDEEMEAVRSERMVVVRHQCWAKYCTWRHSNQLTASGCMIRRVNEGISRALQA